MNILLFKVLSRRKYLLTFLAFSLAMGFFYPVVQVAQQGINNFFFWFSLLKPVDWFFYFVFCLFFGLGFSLFAWRNDNKICSANQKLRTGFWGGVGTFLSVALPVCPQCLTFLALLLPVGVLGILLQHRVWIMGLSAGLMFLSLIVLGAFDRVVDFQHTPEA